MAISKQYLKTKPACKVTFVVPAEQAATAESVVLVGEFNDWQDSAMKKQKNGDFSLTLTLAKDCSYQFRYRLGHNDWLNDEQADEYVASPLSYDQNCLIRL
jgi:1,4-alpha-glucan branching enzyme